MSGFSHLSCVSNCSTQLLVLYVPDCIAVLAGTVILTFLFLTISSGTPVTEEIFFCKEKQINVIKKLSSKKKVIVAISLKLNNEHEANMKIQD